MDNRLVATFAASSLHFNVVQDDAFTSDSVALVNPDRGFYGLPADQAILHRTSTMCRCRSRTG